MKKVITYCGKEYQIKYSYIQEKRIDGYTKNTIEILEINGSKITPYSYEWNDKKDESIIGHVKTAINKYNQEQRKIFSYQSEFELWSGQLDNWDE